MDTAKIEEIMDEVLDRDEPITDETVDEILDKEEGRNAMEKAISRFETVYETVTGIKGRVTAKREDFFSGNVDYYIEWGEETPHGAWFNEHRLIPADDVFKGMFACGYDGEKHK